MLARTWSISLLGAVLSLLAIGCSDRCVTTADCSDDQRCRGGRCQEPAGPPDSDAAPDGDGDADGDADGDSDADGDADGDADRDGHLGLTLTSLAFSQEMHCDLDGDGTNENVFASFPASDLALYSTFLREVLLARVDALVFDMEDIEDPATPRDPSFRCSLVGGTDCDGDRSNNGELDQVIGASDSYYDDGRPVNDFHCALGSGLLRLSSDSMFLEIGEEQILSWGAPSAEVWVEPDLESAEGWVCGYLYPAELAGLSFGVVPGFFMLDALVSGMNQPNIDLDGDGLEHYEIAASHASRCFDGDGSEVVTTDGSHCATSSQMADAYSVLVAFTAIRAELLPPPDGSSCPGF